MPEYSETGRMTGKIAAERMKWLGDDQTPEPLDGSEKVETRQTSWNPLKEFAWPRLVGGEKS